MYLQKYMLNAGFCFYLLILIVSGNVCSAQEAVKLGPSINVNTYTTNDQKNPSVVQLTDSEFLVVWESWMQDGSSNGIYGQLINISGDKISEEFRINTYTSGYQTTPAATQLPSGNIVVTWHSFGQDGDGSGIYGQLFTNSGAKFGDEFQINSYTSDAQEIPTVAGLANGDFVVVWHSKGQDGNSYGIYGQLFNNSGNKNGNEFQINTHTTDKQWKPMVTTLSDGGFVVVWNSNLQDGSGSGLYGQVFDNQGGKQGGEFLVNTYTIGDQHDAIIIALSNNTFLIIWHSNWQIGSDTELYGQIFNSSGTKISREFRVNTYTNGSQGNPAFVKLPSGEFVVVWESNGQDGDGYGIYGQMFSNSGVKFGSEFPVTTHTADNQEKPSIAALASGRFVVTWVSSSYPDNYGVYAQLFDPFGNRLGDEFEAYVLNAEKKQSVTNLAYESFVVVTSAGFDDGIDVNNLGIFAQIFTVIEPDSDEDGMLDLWEEDYFGNIERDGSGDYDGDGISDLDEFINVTNPTVAETAD